MKALVSNLLLIQFALYGCSPAIVSPPTNTPLLPTLTVTPSPRPTATPTSTYTPTLPPIVADTEFVDRIPLPSAGISFVPLMILRVDLAPFQATMVNTDETFHLSLVATSTDPQLRLNDSLNKFLSNMGGEVSDIESSAPIEFEFSGNPAVASDISGSLFGGTFQGRITLVQPDTGNTLYALAISMDPPIGKGWEAEGVRYYSAVLDTIEFFKPHPESSECRVSSDPSYGYEKYNPVQVGGDAYGGPARARAYLDVLLGPEGQIVSYERSGSVPYGETILDLYSLTYSGIGAPATIYIDQYFFDALYALIGFSCSGPFPIAPQ